MVRGPWRELETNAACVLREKVVVPTRLRRSGRTPVAEATRPGWIPGIARVWHRGLSQKGREGTGRVDLGKRRVGSGLGRVKVRSRVA